MLDAQLAGKNCFVCSERIILVSEGRNCRQCTATWHDQCQEVKTCPVCGAMPPAHVPHPSPPATPASTSPRQRFFSDDFRWIFGSIGPYLPFVTTSLAIMVMALFGRVPFSFAFFALMAAPLGPVWSYLIHLGPSTKRHPLVATLWFVFHTMGSVTTGALLAMRYAPPAPGWDAIKFGILFFIGVLGFSFLLVLIMEIWEHFKS